MRWVLHDKVVTSDYDITTLMGPALSPEPPCHPYPNSYHYSILSYPIPSYPILPYPIFSFFKLLLSDPILVPGPPLPACPHTPRATHAVGACDGTTGSRVKVEHEHSISTGAQSAAVQEYRPAGRARAHLRLAVGRQPGGVLHHRVPEPLKGPADRLRLKALDLGGGASAGAAGVRQRPGTGLIMHGRRWICRARGQGRGDRSGSRCDAHITCSE